MCGGCGTARCVWLLFSRFAALVACVPVQRSHVGVVEPVSTSRFPRTPWTGAFMAAVQPFRNIPVFEGLDVDRPDFSAVGRASPLYCSRAFFGPAAHGVLFLRVHSRKHPGPAHNVRDAKCVSRLQYSLLGETAPVDSLQLQGFVSCHFVADCFLRLYRSRSVVFTMCLRC